VNKNGVIRAGGRAILCLYKTDPDKSLEDARLHDFICKEARASTSVILKIYPLTSDTCKYHSVRVYLQVQEWKGSAMDPLENGWEMVDNKLFPIAKDKTHVPIKLMKIAPCYCKGGCGT